MKKNHISNPIKKIIQFSILNCFLLSAFCFLLPVAVSAQFSGGDGTSGNPYIITTQAELTQLATYVNALNTTYNDKYYKLGNDIDLSDYQTGTGWIIIGRRVGITNYSFKGDFDGNNHKITGLYINDPNRFYQGLFGMVDYGTVRNLGVEGANIAGGGAIGALIGYATYSTITNCYSTGSVSCPTSGFIDAGGLIGSIDSCMVSGCYSTATVTGDYAGGLIGFFQGMEGFSTVINCYSTGNVNGHQNTGGISSMVQKAGSNITNCYSTGNVTGNNWVGGISGNISNYSAITNCYSLGNISGAAWIGGIVGMIDNWSTVSHCYATGSVTGSSNTGGIAGRVANSSNANNCAALNISVSSPGASGRVTGSLTDGGTVTSNIAFEGMLNYNGTTSWNNIGLNDRDGESISKVAIHADGTLGGRFTSAGGWTTFNGLLPGFVVPTPMPVHLRLTDAPVITTETLPNGEIDIPYSHTLTATGATPITWVLQGGSLPTGLSLSTAGVISGTPTTAGAFFISVRATNSIGSDIKNFILTVIDVNTTPPTITTTTLPNGETGVPYNQTLTATGDTPIIWSLQSGSLPTGLSLSPEGIISGTPTATGTFTFTVKATNNFGNDTKILTIIIENSAVPPAITTTMLPHGTVEIAYSETLTAIGDNPIIWSLQEGNLPTGLELSTNGIISGIPTNEGTFTFTVKATNNAGNDTKELSIIIEKGEGIEENLLVNIAIYPNPTTGELRITNYELRITNIEVFDVYGKCHSLVVSRHENGEAVVNVSYFPAGIYFLKIQTNKGAVTKQIIKQ
ncbi:MAG: putative Ig domain-containing protein [Bacteroidetes bacterium]|nr:putative Ig domain-containing protein [Bacteroidota bacterium]MCL1968413.1 putative Ig domain-containing protein [Bacteroidota bacterium]